MKQNRFGIFLFVALLASCLDDKEIERNYPKVVTDPVTEISPTGVTLSGTIESSSLDEIIEYGFIWGREENLLPANSFSVKFGKPTSNVVSAKTKSALFAQEIYYVRFYIKTAEKTIYANRVTFKSLGSEGPVIKTLKPSSGVIGDTITIHGNNFAFKPGINFAQFGSQDIKIRSFTDTTIVVIIPQDISVETARINVSVSVEGNIAKSPEPFTLLLSEIVPVITMVTPKDIKSCDTILVVGKNFRSIGAFPDVVLANNEQVNLIKATDDSVMFSIKLLPPGEFGFTVKSGRFETKSQNDFKELRPEYNSVSPPAFKPGAIMTLAVKNFPTCFPVTATWYGYNIDIISIKENEVKIKIPEYSCFGTSMNITFNTNSSGNFMTTPAIPIQTPKILSVEPNHGTADQEVIIRGENFFFLEEGFTNFLNITSYTDTEIKGIVREVYAPSGLIDVEVNSCGQMGVLENGFKFDAPVIYDFNPKTITSRDQVITVSGANFSPGALNNVVSFSNSTSTTYASSNDGKQLTIYASYLIPDDLVETKLSTLMTIRTPVGMEVTTTVNLTIDYDGPWKKLQDFPGEARYNAVGFSIAGKGYAGLGEGVTDWYTTHLTDLWEYDPATDDWTQKASFPGTHAYDVNNTVVANDKAYYMNQNKEFWEYDPLLDHWERKADYPGLATAGTIAVTINNKIYMGGGFKDGSTQVYDFWEYNPLLNTWLRVADAPSPVSKPQVFYERGGKMYTYSQSILGQKFLLTYNPVTNVWTSQAFDYPDTKLTEQIFSFSNYVYVGRAYCCGGFDQVLTKINPTNNASTTVSYRGPLRHWYTGFTIGNFGYIGFGRTANNQILKEVWRFDPEKF